MIQKTVFCVILLNYIVHTFSQTKQQIIAITPTNNKTDTALLLSNGNWTDINFDTDGLIPGYRPCDVITTNTFATNGTFYTVILITSDTLLDLTEIKSNTHRDAQLFTIDFNTRDVIKVPIPTNQVEWLRSIVYTSVPNIIIGTRIGFDLRTNNVVTEIGLWNIEYGQSPKIITAIQRLIPDIGQSGVWYNNRYITTLTNVTSGFVNLVSCDLSGQC